MTNDLEQRIRERAYQLWELGGRVDGRAEEYWYAASRELIAPAAIAPARNDDIVVSAEVAPEPKTRRRATKAATGAVTASAAAPRRRRSSTPVLSS